MLNNSQLYDLIFERFDPNQMKEQVLDAIDDMIDYEELAQEIVSEHEAEISGLIAEMAEDALR